MAVEGQQTPPRGRLQGPEPGADPGLLAEGGAKQLGMVVVARQQDRCRYPPRCGGGEGFGELGSQNLAKTPVAVPALVMAEIAADQQPIRERTVGLELGEGLPEPMTQQGRWPSAPQAAGRVRQQVGIAELQEAEAGDHSQQVLTSTPHPGADAGRFQEDPLKLPAVKAACHALHPARHPSAL